MKKILFVALAATLLAAGCQKTEIINRVGDRIGFTSEMGKLTKAEGDTEDQLASLKKQNFKVWAYTAYEDALNGKSRGQIYDEIEGIEIKYDAAATTENKWVTSNNMDYYWPGKEYDLDFYGVSTGKEDITVTITSPGTEALGTRKVEITGYEVATETADDDLMVAEFVRQNQTDKDSKAVSMHFNHALAKVTFSFKTSGSKDVIVTALEVNQLTLNGTLTATEKSASNNNTNNGSGSNPENGGQVATRSTTENDATRAAIDLKWTAAAAPKTDKVTRTFTNDKLTSTAVPYTTWLVIPQTLEGKNVKISYKIGDKEFTHVFALADNAKLPTGWDVNQSITYTITLTPNTISFVPSVQPWDEEKEITEVN